MKKKVLLVAVAATLITGLAACSSGGTDPSSTSAAPGPDALDSASGVTEISIWHGLGASAGEAFEKLIDEFNTANEGKIHVTSTYQGAYADLLAKYTAGVRTNDVPTVLLAGDVATGFLVDLGQTIPATSLAQANPEDLNVDDLVPAAANYYTVDGTLEAVPMNVSTPMLWVNWDLMAQAGLSKDTPLATLDDVVAAAKTVSEKTGEAGFTMPSDDWYIEQLTATAGQNFCDPDNGRNGTAPTGITINTGDAKDAISKISELYTSGAAVDGDPRGDAAYSIFTAGKVALDLYSSGVAGGFSSDAQFDYSALPFPTNSSSEDAGNIIGGSALWSSSTGTPAEQVAGWKLTSFLASPEAQEEFSQATGYVPINQEVASSATEKDYLAANPGSQVIIDQVQNTPVSTVTAGCVTGAMTSIRTSNMNQIQAAWAGQKSIGEALDQAAEDAKAALEQYQTQLGE